MPGTVGLREWPMLCCRNDWLQNATVEGGSLQATNGQEILFLLSGVYFAPVL
jgi:hypothetical protein